MEKKDFNIIFTVNAATGETMKKISEVNLWWAKNFSGSAEKLNDKFTVRFGETFVDFLISEFIPNKKVVWKVADCYLPWINDKKEWNNTEVVFEISSENNKTKIEFTHIRLLRKFISLLSSVLSAPAWQSFYSICKALDGHRSKEKTEKRRILLFLPD